jgi:FtsZ-binding cell division protein ZapB
MNMTKWDADKEALRQRVDALLCRIQDVEAKLDKLINVLQDDINGLKEKRNEVATD